MNLTKKIEICRYRYIVLGKYRLSSYKEVKNDKKNSEAIKVINTCNCTDSCESIGSSELSQF